MEWTVRDGDGFARLIAHLGNFPHPFRVTILAGDDRSKAQNRLSHRWYREIGQQKDDMDTKDARAYCKLNIGVKILHAENEEFREAWNRLIRSRFIYEDMLELMLPPHDYPVTRIMTTKQMGQYLDAIFETFTKQGVRLTDPELLRVAA